MSWIKENKWFLLIVIGILLVIWIPITGMLNYDKIHQKLLPELEIGKKYVYKSISKIKPNPFESVSQTFFVPISIKSNWVLYEVHDDKLIYERSHKLKDLKMIWVKQE